MDVISQILSYVVPLAAVCASYILGRVAKSHISRREYLLKRYNEFYVPFIQAFFAGYLWSLPINKLSFDARSKFFDHIMQNIQHLDEHTLSLVPDFYKAFLGMLEYEDSNPKYSDAPKQFADIFNKVIRSVLLESIRLSKLTKQTSLGKTALQLYDQYGYKG
ncbi:MAG TPA: hypothetical protein PLZ84_01750 [Clostridia bacterium]|nr:hypothetical protein [Clostridia bacterium]